MLTEDTGSKRCPNLLLVDPSSAEGVVRLPSRQSQPPGGQRQRRGAVDVRSTTKPGSRLQPAACRGYYPTRGVDGPQVAAGSARPSCPSQRTTNARWTTCQSRLGSAD